MRKTDRRKIAEQQREGRGEKGTNLLMHATLFADLLRDDRKLRHTVLQPRIFTFQHIQTRFCLQVLLLPHLRTASRATRRLQTRGEGKGREDMERTDQRRNTKESEGGKSTWKLEDEAR